MSQSQQSGKQYLLELTEEFVAYKKFISGISNQAFEHQKSIDRLSDGVAGFLADFALAAEEDRRSIVRWKTKEKLPEATKKQMELITAILPKFVIFNKEAVSGMEIKNTRRHKIDLVCEEIMCEIVKRLSRKIDAYRYHQNHATETLNITGIGQIEVELTQNHGLFTSIRSIKADEFYIGNGRDTGIIYLNKYIDLSNPDTININPLDLQLEIFRDGSGLESRNYTAFSKLQDEAIVWLAENVLNPLRLSPTPKHQIDVPDMEVAFPNGLFSSLYTFAERIEINKIAILQENGVEAAFPDERFALTPNRRLVPIGYDTRGLPKEVHDGFIWCSTESLDEALSKTDHQIGIIQRDTWSFSGSEGIVEVFPLTATDIYVVDWNAWEEYRKVAFSTGKQELNNHEVGEMYRALAKTFIPITDYNNDYVTPIVLIGRNLEVSEVGKQYTFPD